MNASNKQIPVVDVDQAFPSVVDRSGSASGGSQGGAGDVGPQVAQAVRDVLGMRPRTQDPKAFLDALQASFKLRMVQGHVEADYVPRGAAVQSDLGAVTGGQASLYRRATMARREMLRILDALTPMRPDADPDDMASYRTLVRDSVQRLVDELGNPGGPRVQMVDMYFAGLTGSKDPVSGVDADTVAGQLGALRDRFGLTNDNSNTVDDEAVRTSFWTLVDLVTDLQGTWASQKLNFGSQSGQGFLGTDLIVLSRLMEAAADQVDELERILDSVLIPETERRTIVLADDTGLTLDGLLTWLRTFLGDEGRRIAQDTGRDGIVSALAPMAVEVVQTFKRVLADKLDHAWTQARTPATRAITATRGTYLAPSVSPILYLPISCCAPLPAGMYAARSQIAVASLCRLLMELAKTAQRIGRFSQPILFDVTLTQVDGRDEVVLVEVRGLNLQQEYAPAMLTGSARLPAGRCQLDAIDHLLVRCLDGSSSWDEDSLNAYFRRSDLSTVSGLTGNILSSVTTGSSVTLPAESVALAIVDVARNTALLSPAPVTYPRLRQASWPIPVNQSGTPNWHTLGTSGSPRIAGNQAVVGKGARRRRGKPGRRTHTVSATTTIPSTMGGNLGASPGAATVPTMAPPVRNPAVTATQQSAAKKSAVKATVAKKSAAKKTAAKTTAAKKTAAKKTAAKTAPTSPARRPGARTTTTARPAGDKTTSSKGR